MEGLHFNTIEIIAST